MSTGISPSDPLWDVDMDSDDNEEIGEDEDSQILEAAGRRRRTSSFGSKLKSRKRRPSHLASDPTYLQPVMETSAKKGIKRRASTGGAGSTPSYGGLSGSDGAVRPLSAAPDTTHEETEYVSMSEYYQFRDYPELENPDWRKSVISPKTRSKHSTPEVDERKEEDDIYLFNSTEKISNQYTDKPLPPQSGAGKGTLASGGDRDSTSPSSEYEPVQPSPSDDLRNYIQKDDNDYAGLVSPDGTAMGNEYESFETETTGGNTTKNSEASGKGDTQDTENLSSNNIKTKGGPSNEVKSSPDELSHKVDTRSSQQSNRSSRVGMANKPLPELPQNVLRIDVKSAEDNVYSLLGSHQSLDPKNDAQDECYEEVDVDEDVYDTIGGENYEDLKSVTKHYMAPSQPSSMKKGSLTPGFTDSEKPPPLPPRKVTISAPTPPSKVKLAASRKQSAKSQLSSEEEAEDAYGTYPAWFRLRFLKLKSNEPLANNQSRRPTAYFWTTSDNQNIPRASVAPGSSDSYVDGRRVSAFNYGQPDDKYPNTELLRRIGRISLSKFKKFPLAVGKVIEHEKSEQSKDILMRLRKGDPSVETEKGMKTKVMDAFLTVTRLFKRDSQKDRDGETTKKDKRRSSLKCMTCGVFNCGKGH